jgi:DNA-binding NtrC family response regulator
MPHQPRVLVVDDDPNILSAFEDFLRREHCAMISASSAEEAMERIEEYHFDLLITDIRLRHQSGVTFFMQAKALQPNIPVIVITGYPDLVSEAELKLYGADYFFLKPLELNRIREAVRSCLHLNNSSHHKHR